MKYIILLFVLITFSGLSQNNKQTHEATYVRILSHNDPALIDTISLFFNKHHSLFVHPAKITEEKDSKQVNEMDMSVHINISLDTGEDYVLFTDLKTKTITTRETVYGKTGAVSYLVKEKIKTPQWKIFSEQKQVGKFLCTKARINFRGRVYTVWFTEDIKSRFGPWKLNGLPGLILEATDESGDYSFFIIEYNNKSNTQKISEPTGNPEIGLKEYRNLLDLQAKNIVEHIQSKLPRGATFTLDSVEKDYQELQYEWEK